ncbi:MAG TPA: NAD kinase [Bacteroidia bacterium]
MTIAIYGRKLGSGASLNALRTLLLKLEKAKVKVLFYQPFLEEIKKRIKLKSSQTFSTHKDLEGKVKFLFSLGGDGTLLDTVTLIRDSEIPVMGINTGRLGFLSSISIDEIEAAVDAVLKGHYVPDKRTLLELNVKGNYFSGCRYALNEITVQKADSSSMITIHASLNGKFLNTYWADGLITSTPTGSTAYSLSCGGPIVMPDSDNFVITPVAPHNLNVRPVIISSNDVLTLEIEGRNPNYLVSLDSRSETIASSVKLSIKKADFLISLVKLHNHDFLSTLRNKLMWGIDKRN